MTARTSRLLVALLCVLSCGALTAAPAVALPERFGTHGSRAGQISANPQGIAVEQESGDVYVADTGNARIDKFGPEGEFLLAWGWGVADGETQALQTCTTTCFIGLEGSGAGEFFGGPEGIGVDNGVLSLSHGDVYVVDPRNNRVQKFGPNGEFLLMFGREVNATTKGNVCGVAEACQAGGEGAEPGEFERLTGRSVAVDSEGTVYVGDRNRVQRFSEAGVVQSPQLEFAGFGSVLNLAVDSAKNIYVRGSNREVLGVHKYEPAGKELGTPRDPAGFADALNIAIGPGDELFVNDLRENHHILSFNVEGEQTASFDRGGGAENAQAIASSNITKAIYVLNPGTVRIVTPPPPGPFVVLGSETASEIQPPTASLGALVNPEGAATEYHFEYGTTTAYGESTPISPPLTAVNEVQSVTVAATGGHFRLSFKGEQSGEIPFNATAAEVQAALEGVPGLGAGQVAVTGEPGGPWSVEFTGAHAGEDVPQLGANPGSLEGPEPTAAVATTTPGFSLFDDRAASAAVAGLLPSTLYHYRVVATNGSQTNNGPDQTFTTLPPVSIDATSASQIDATSARLEAELNPHGLPSEYRFEYGTTTAYGTNAPVPDASAGSSTTDTTVSNLIQELQPATTYHYRVVAHNALNKPGEVVQGPDHTFTTQGASSTLPDGRAWELVSPPNKHGSPLEPITEQGGLIQAAAGGGGMAYVALGPINAEPKGVRSPHDTQLLAARSSKGWQTQDITTPHEEVAQILVGSASEYQFFAEDLTPGAVEPVGATPLSPHTTERTPYRREADGEFVPLVTAANVPPGTKFGGEQEGPHGPWINGVNFVTATPDLGHVVLKSPQLLAPGFKPGFESTRENLYELAGGSLGLLSVLPNGEPASEAGLTAAVGDGNVKVRGAISSDGNRVVFVASGGGRHLYQRDVGLGETLQLDVKQPGAAGGNGAPVFQAASSDGKRVFFTDVSQLTADATATPSQPDLYMCEIGESAGHLTCALSDLSVDPNAGEAARVAGKVAAVDGSGGHVYFAASGVLTSTPNAHGEIAVRGSCANNGGATCNLYEYDTSARQIKLVAVLSGSDAPDWVGATFDNFGSLTARSSPDGRWFTFMSQRSLTGYDNRDTRSGQADEEVYLFDAASGKLSCTSCNPTGARPLGVFDKEAFPGLLVDHPHTWNNTWLASSIPGWTKQWLGAARYQSRYLSNDGRVFFNSSDALVPQDTNNVMDVYEFEPPGVGDCTTSSRTYSPTSGGCVSLISSGSSKEESAFLDASESGDEVFFLTASRLTASDVDGSFDVYDAHVCGSSSPCPPPPPPPAPACEGDACQTPSTPPNDATPGSLTYSGPGNAAPPPAASVRPKAKRTRAQLLARALTTCRKKHSKPKRLACERQVRKRYGANKATRTTRPHRTR
jgi:hypothetical protein